MDRKIYTLQVTKGELFMILNALECVTDVNDLKDEYAQMLAEELHQYFKE